MKSLPKWLYLRFPSHNQVVRVGLVRKLDFWGNGSLTAYLVGVPTPHNYEGIQEAWVSPIPSDWQAAFAKQVPK